GYTWTVGASGFIFVAGTVSGTFGVDLSAAAGVYTQTAGTIAAAAILTVTTGTGGAALTALTKTGTLNITHNATTGNIVWATAAKLNTLTINPGKTLTQIGIVRVTKLAGSGTFAGAAQVTYWYPAANTDWDWTGTISGTGLFHVRPTAALTIGSALDFGTRPVSLSDAASSLTLTLSGLAGGALTITPFSAGVTTTLVTNGPSSGTTITLGTGADATKAGALVLGTGCVHTWGALAVVAGSTAAHAMTYGGSVAVSGTQDWDSITVSLGRASVKITDPTKIIDADNVTAITSIGAHIHGGSIQNIDVVPSANPIYHFGPAAADVGTGIIQMPSTLMATTMAG
ncbi:hypothetical protein IMZ48_23920, partial [Candidatus Bathyarchaeota archaeon]|nr:hypothetical protein [Candidatus Bathyarchaeota archaeon]